MSEFSGSDRLNVVSLDEFRARVAQEPSVTTSPDLLRVQQLRDGDYDFLQYPAYGPLKGMLEFLSPGTSRHNLIIAVRDTEEECHPGVFYSYEGADKYIAVERNINEMESLTLALHSDESKHHLLNPIETFYTGTLIAESLLGGEQKMNLNQVQKTIANPRIGDTEVNVAHGERMKEVTSWRTAAGIALQAVAVRHPKLREEIENHLTQELDNRLQYELSRQRFGWLLGVTISDECVISDRQLGMCNPLSPMELRAVLREEDDGWVPLV